jgi:hypothetical protein
MGEIVRFIAMTGHPDGRIASPRSSTAGASTDGYRRTLLAAAVRALASLWPRQTIRPAQPPLTIRSV